MQRLASFLMAIGLFLPACQKQETSKEKAPSDASEVVKEEEQKPIGREEWAPIQTKLLDR